MHIQVSEILLRLVIGGTVVSIFSLMGSLFKPKSFGGLFGAAPSIALATLGLAITAKGSSYVATEAKSMVAGAIAFFIYASSVKILLGRYALSALSATSMLILIWFVAAFSLWALFLR
jgi:uncharacterized membrane protein (GlpM family)